MSTPRSKALHSAAGARSIAAEQRAQHAIAELDRRGQPITFLAVAAEAGVSARYLYAHPQLRATIEQLRDERHSTPSRPPSRHPRASDESLRARLRGALEGEQATPRREHPATRRTRARARRSPRAEARKPPQEHGMSEWPAPVAEQALHGPAGEFVLRTEPHSEAHPMALLVQFLVAFGCACGRGAHYQVEADRHYSNEFVVLVGPTATGRKGSSWGHVRRLLADADQAFGRCLVAASLPGRG